MAAKVDMLVEDLHRVWDEVIRITRSMELYIREFDESVLPEVIFSPCWRGKMRTGRYPNQDFREPLPPPLGCVWFGSSFCRKEDRGDGKGPRGVSIHVNYLTSTLWGITAGSNRVLAHCRGPDRSSLCYRYRDRSHRATECLARTFKCSRVPGLFGISGSVKRAPPTRGERGAVIRESRSRSPTGSSPADESAAEKSDLSRLRATSSAIKSDPSEDAG